MGDPFLTERQILGVEIGAGVLERRTGVSRSAQGVYSIISS